MANRPNRTNRRGRQTRDNTDTIDLATNEHDVDAHLRQQQGQNVQSVMPPTLTSMPLLDSFLMGESDTSLMSLDMMDMIIENNFEEQKPQITVPVVSSAPIAGASQRPVGQPGSSSILGSRRVINPPPRQGQPQQPLPPQQQQQQQRPPAGGVQILHSAPGVLPQSAIARPRRGNFSQAGLGRTAVVSTSAAPPPQSPIRSVGRAINPNLGASSSQNVGYPMTSAPGTQGALQTPQPQQMQSVVRTKITPAQSTVTSSNNNMLPPGGTFYVARKPGNAPVPPAQSPLTPIVIKSEDQVCSLSNQGIKTYPTYNASFTGFLSPHKQIMFTVPSYFFNYYDPVPTPNKRTLTLFKFNSRALSLEIDSDIFGEFVSRLVGHVVMSKSVPFHLEIKDTPSTWVETYSKAAVVQLSNCEYISQRVADAFIRNNPKREEELLITEPFDLHVTARPGMLLLMGVKDTTDSSRVKHSKGPNTKKTMHTQTESVIMPAYFTEMVREQNGKSTLKDMEVLNAFNQHHEHIRKMESVQQGILGHLNGVKILLQAFLNKEALLTHPTLTNPSKECQVEEPDFFDTLENIPTDFIDQKFKNYEEFCKRCIRYATENYQVTYTAYSKLLAENKDLKAEIKKEDAKEKEFRQKVEKEQQRSKQKHDEKRDSDKKASTSRKTRDKDEKKSTSKDRENKENKDPKKIDRSRSSSTSSKKRAPKEDDEPITLVKYIDGIADIMQEHPISKYEPKKPEPQSKREVKREFEYYSDIAIHPDMPKVENADFLALLNTLNGNIDYEQQHIALKKEAAQSQGFDFNAMYDNHDYTNYLNACYATTIG